MAPQRTLSPLGGLPFVLVGGGDADDVRVRAAEPRLLRDDVRVELPLPAGPKEAVVGGTALPRTKILEEKRSRPAPVRAESTGPCLGHQVEIVQLPGRGAEILCGRGSELLDPLDGGPGREVDRVEKILLRRQGQAGHDLETASRPRRDRAPVVACGFTPGGREVAEMVAARGLLGSQVQLIRRRCQVSTALHDHVSDGLGLLERGQGSPPLVLLVGDRDGSRLVVLEVCVNQHWDLGETGGSGRAEAPLASEKLVAVPGRPNQDGLKHAVPSDRGRELRRLRIVRLEAPRLIGVGIDEIRGQIGSDGLRSRRTVRIWDGVLLRGRRAIAGHKNLRERALAPLRALRPRRPF